MAVTLDTIPSAKTGTIEEIAEWYAANLDSIQAFDSAMWHVKRRLTEAIRDMGPLQTKAGKLAIEPTSYDYPSEIADEFPTLGRHTVSAVVDTIEQAERLLDLITEQDPQADVAHAMKVDGRLVASYLKTAAPDQAARLLGLRTPRGKLALR